MIVYLNGQFIPEDEAHISVLDRGFLFGDGVYELIPVYGKKLFRLPHHLQRLQQSLQSIRLENPLTDEQWQNVLEDLVKQNDGQDLSVYLQVTRGVAKRDHALPEKVVPTVFAMANPLLPVSKEILEKGAAAITLDDIRWKSCNIKAIALLANVLLRQQAVDQGAVEAILIRDNKVTEGAASNVFLVKHNTIYTPATGPLLLPGITRDLVLELAKEANIACCEQNIVEELLFEADEVWLTSSTKEIVPITTLNGQPVGSGKPGPVWFRMIDLYQNFKQNLRQNV